LRAFPKSFDRVEDDGEPASVKPIWSRVCSPNLNGILRQAGVAIKARRSTRLVEIG
jgi:hypothetical protein